MTRTTGSDARGSAGVLAVLTDANLRDELDRVAAAVGVRVVHAGGSAVGRKTWSAAAAVVLDAASAERCGRASLPRRAHVSVLTAAEPGTETWAAAIAVGTQHVLRLPGQEHELIRELGESAESIRDDGLRGEVVAVIGGDRDYFVVWGSSAGLVDAETRFPRCTRLVSDSEQRVADGFPVVVDQDGFPVEEILGFFVARNYSARSTSAQYARVFARLCEFLEFRSARSLLDATQKDLSAYRIYRTQTAAQPISQYAFRVEATALRQFYTWAVDSGRLRQSPVKKLSKVGRDNLSTNRIRHSKVRHVDGYLYEKWLEEAGRRSAGGSVRSARERNIAAFKTLVSTGLRIQELASLLTLDIDNGQLLKHAMCVEIESITKYEINGNAIIPIYALAAIRKYRKLERPNVVVRHQRSLVGQLDGCFTVEHFDPGTRRIWGLWRGRRRQYLLHQVPVDMRLKAVIVSADGIVEPLCLFLSDSRGLGMTRSGWEGVFTATSEQLIRRYPEDRQVRKVTPHDLRHTFAIN